MKGVIVGCDQNQEWLLPWWWNHYSKHNDFPVCFIDFGLSKEAVSWCKERGEVIALLEHPPLKKVSSKNQKTWETRVGPILPFRSAWFKKPLACLQSPFEYSLWIDLDCEVRGSIDPLFNYLIPGIEIALVAEDLQGRNQELPGEITYNSGVVAFRKKAPILFEWADLSCRENHLFMGDQNVLSRAIFLTKPLIIALPPIYNWKKSDPINPKSVIVHYAASSKVKIIQTLRKKYEKRRCS